MLNWSRRVPPPRARRPRLAAPLTLVLLLWLGSVRPAAADHFSRSTAVCTTQVSTITCTLTIGPFSGTVLSNERITVSVSGAVELDPAAPPRVTAVGPAPCTAAVQSSSVTRTSFVVAVGVAGCPAGAAITVSEAFVVVGSGGGTLRQTLSSPSIEPATITAVTPGGVIFPVPSTLGGALKVCAWAPATAIASVSCVLTLGPLAGLTPGQTVTVRIAVPAAGVSFVTVEPGGGCGMSGPHGLTATSFFIALTAVCTGTEVLVIRETLAVATPDGGPLCQAVAAGSLPAVQVCAVTPTGTPFTLRNPAAPATPALSAAATCTPARPGEPVSCAVTVTALPPPEGDPRLSGPARVTLSGGRFPDGATGATVTCTALTLGAPAAVGAPARGATCGFTVTLLPAAACVTPTLVVELLGVTLSPPLRTLSGEPLVTLPVSQSQGCPGAPSSPTPPATLALSCTHSPGVAWLLAQDEVPSLPEQATRAVDAVALLPEVVSCYARLLDDAGRELEAPPGTVRVSTLAGGLLDAAGRAVTLLPLPCGGLPRLAGGLDPATLRPTACTGVEFSVVGTRVGVVEVHARYEPGIGTGAAPLEGAVRVAFVAPAVSLRLTVGREPLTTGTTGRARVTLTTVGRLCRLAACVDPVTGVAVRPRTGAALSGTVLFSSDAPAVVTWTGANGSGAQATARCGQPPAHTATGAPLADYFRGCTTVTATFQAVAAGEAGLSVLFVPDLPGASVDAAGFGALPPPVAALVRFFTGLATLEDGVTVVVEEPAAP